MSPVPNRVDIDFVLNRVNSFDVQNGLLSELFLVIGINHPTQDHIFPADIDLDFLAEKVGIGNDGVVSQFMERVLAIQIMFGRHDQETFLSNGRNSEACK